MRQPRPDDDVGSILTAAGIAAWGEWLGEQRIRAANAGREQPVDCVAEDEEGLAGFAAWDSATGEITRLYVHPRAWGSGVARALLDAALNALRAAGRTSAYLVTEERNARALAFYAREGFRADCSARERDWHGVALREPRLVRDL